VLSHSRVAAASEFPVDRLVAAKADHRLSVSVVLPARDEADTVGAIVDVIRRDLVERHRLVDELVVVDDGSTDATAERARAAGARVVAAADVLPELGPGSGKGDVLWKSLHATSGDVVCWVDADLEDFSSHFVTGLLGPLLTVPSTVFSKGFYRRPLGDDPDGGGRVTELLARPVISKLFPYLTGFVQPLAGEYAGRRHALESVPFTEGWGVELGLLIDLCARFGLEHMAQVDLGVRRHRNRTLHELGPQAMAILTVALRKAGIPESDAWGDEFVRYLPGRGVERVPVEVRERPPMREVSAYRQARSA
jgi:glucosyl-3-phosphoglycerate synthase